MNNLEFIEKEIEKLKEFLELDDVLCLQTDEDYKFWYDRLKMFQQIKTILEAWEVVKPKIKFEDLGEMQNGNMYRGYFDDCFDEGEYNKTEKALEVEND